MLQAKEALGNASSQMLPAEERASKARGSGKHSSELPPRQSSWHQRSVHPVLKTAAAKML